MEKYFPFLDWLRGYRKQYFLKDLIAGITVGIVLIPQAMAYAMIAGLPPVYGLYSAVFPLLVYALLGTSRKLAIGPSAMDSLLVAAGLGALAITGVDNYIAMAIFLAFSVGFIQFILGVFRLGFLVNFLSKPVIMGFTSAAALIIMINQLKHLFGVNIAKSNKFHQLVLNTIEKFGEINRYDLAIGLSGIFLILLFKKWNRKIPSILLVVILSVSMVYFLNLESYGVKIVGEVPKGLPMFQIPDISIKNILDIWPIALTLALIGYLEAISIGKALEEKSGKETISTNQELLALGSSNIVGSFFQSYPVAASFSRSAISGESGVKTNIGSMFAVVLVILTLLYLTPLFYYLPNSILASIIVVSIYNLIDFSYAKYLWINRRNEFVVFIITFLTALFVGILQGILLGVLISLLLMVYRTSKPHFAVLGNIKNSDYYKNINRFADEVEVRDDLLIVRFDAQLYFGNAAYFKKQLYKNVHEKGDKLKAIVLNAEAINYIDNTAANMLTKVIKEIHKKDIQFFIAGAIGPTRDIIFNSGIIKELPKKFLFVKIKEAVAYFDSSGSIPPLVGKVAHQNHVNGN